MKIKAEFKGSFVYVKELNRMVEVNDININLISRFKHLFNDVPNKTKRKRSGSDSEGNGDNIKSELPI